MARQVSIPTTQIFLTFVLPPGHVPDTCGKMGSSTLLPVPAGVDDVVPPPVAGAGLSEIQITDPVPDLHYQNYHLLHENLLDSFHLYSQVLLLV